MFANPKYLEQATNVAEQLKHEDGVETACNALERLYTNTRKRN
jgi:hypothetical protein